MSLARNLGEVGARLIQTGAVDLSASGNIQAATFQGSGRLLTDLFTLTGGNITLNVGSTRQFKTIQSAINSLSAYSLDTTANVTISADPETINEDAWKVLRLYHPNGDRISLIGGISQIKSINNPIVSVVTASAGSLSATFTVDPTTLTLGRTVQKGDLIGIYSVSARDAYHSVNSYNGTDSGGHVLVGGSTSGTLDIPALGGFPVTNCWCILGAASADGMMQTYLSVVTAGVTMNPTGSQPVMGLSGNLLKNWPGTLPLTVDLGSPTSIRFSGGQPVRILSAFPVGNVGQHIVFNGGGATNTWMNEGDLIITCGQTCVVKQVSSTAAVDVYTRMKFTTGGVLSGYTDRFGPIPHPGLHFFVRTFGERYRGVFRVEDVTGNNVTISVPDATYYSWTYNSVLYKFPVIPLPRYGIEKIGEVEVLNNSSGNQINAPITIHTTKIRTIGTTIPSNNIKNISRMAFDFTYENSLSGGNNGLNLGYDPEGVVASATSSVVLGSYVSFYNFLYGIWATNASTLTQSGNGSLAIGCNREVSLVRTGVTSLKRSLVNISGFNICGPTLGLYAYNEGSIIGSYGAIHGGFQWFVATDGSSLTFSYVNFCETGTTYEYFSPSYLTNYANATIGYSRFYVRQHLYYGIGITYSSTLKLTYCNMDGNKKEISTLPALQFLTWPDYSGIINSFGCSFTGADIGWNMRFAATGSSERDLFINTSTALNLNVNSELTAGIGGYYNLYMFNNVFAYVNAKSSLVINDSPRNAFQLGYVAGSGDPKGVYISASLYPYQLRNVAYTNLATGFTSATFTFLSLA